MIEPLRLNIVNAEPATARTPLFCENCKSKLETRKNPNLAIKWCPHCLHRKFLCKRCDEEVHRLKPLKLHVRHLLVVGPGVRKKVLYKGDGVHYPRPLDMVSVRVRTDAYQEGNRVLREPAKEALFYTGLSGDCVHVQILGAKRVLPASRYYRTPTSTELEPTASPFISASYAGRDLGDTKIRSHTLSPKWTNETVIVPVEDGAALRALVRRFEELQQMEHFHPFGADKVRVAGKCDRPRVSVPLTLANGASAHAFSFFGQQEKKKAGSGAGGSEKAPSLAATSAANTARGDAPPPHPEGEAAAAAAAAAVEVPVVPWVLSSERKEKNSLRLEVRAGPGHCRWHHLSTVPPSWPGPPVTYT